MSPGIPKTVTRFLAKVCKPEIWESVEGDLHELFLLDIDKKGLKKARRNYVLNAMAFLDIIDFKKCQTQKLTTQCLY